MKKVMALLMALVLVLSLVACGGGSGNGEEKKDSNSKDIEITLDNYSKYFDITSDAWCDPDIDNSINVGSLNGGKGIHTEGSYWATVVYKSIEFSVDVSGLSQNYNYNDIVVKGKLTGIYETYDGGKDSSGLFAFNNTKTYEKEISIECDITGVGFFAETINGSGESYHDDLAEAKFEITSISGSVSSV